jgi:hypothetical protein
LRTVARSSSSTSPYRRSGSVTSEGPSTPRPCPPAARRAGPEPVRR